MRKIVSISFFLLVAVFAICAQTATSNPQAKLIIDKALANMQRSPFKFEFTTIYIPGNQSEKQTQKGVLALNGNKMYISLAGMETFFDGKTQWVYVAKNNEVSISEPTMQELKELNPLLMIRDYGKSHRVVFDEVTEDGVWHLILYPTVAQKVDYFRISLTIDKSTNLLKKIEFSQRNADKVIFSIQKQVLLEPTANLFTFDTSKHPHVEINDLR